MFETVVVSTDGSASVRRAVEVACDLARRFDAEIHALYVVDTDEIDAAPDRLREEMADSLRRRGERAVDDVRATAPGPVTTAVREGRPAAEICEYVREHDVDVVAMGTRGRHGENRFLLGSVAERVVRTCPTPVLTVRMLSSDEDEAGVDGAVEA